MIRKLRCIFNRNRCYYQTEIDMQQLNKMVGEGAVLLDVRSPQEFNEGHLDKAISLPEYEINKNVIGVLPDKMQVIILYCSTGHRSQKAQKILRSLGYKQVYNLQGGLENYNFI